MNTHKIPITRGRYFVPVLLSCLMIMANGVASSAYAAANTTQTSAVNVDPTKTRNKRQLTKHSARKAAARHLRVAYQKMRQQKLDRWVNSHHGYTGSGRRG